MTTEQKTAELKLAIAIEALENIKNPISYLQKEAKKEHKQFDGQMGVAISNDPWYLKGVADQALQKIR